jgi:hypothetical protein
MLVEILIIVGIIWFALLVILVLLALKVQAARVCAPHGADGFAGVPISQLAQPKAFYARVYAPHGADGFTGVPISQLAQPKAFYAANRAQTLKYLKAVYPAGVDTLTEMSDLELASFYNSLWFYYNCKGQYHDADLQPLKGSNNTSWDPLPCWKEYALPYVPQGWLYNFWTYNKYNVPVIYSDSDASKPYLQVENASSTRAGIMGSYQGRWARPNGIMWLVQRSIQRDVWYPNGLKNVKDFKGSSDNWSVSVGMPSSFMYPQGWYGELSNDQYIEVTHSPSDTGDVLNMSPWWWYNVTPGSGMFLDLGKTIAVKNKITGIFVMAQQLTKTSRGRDVLKRWYNTIDPYQITWGIVGLCGYDLKANQMYCNFSLQECGNACEPHPLGYANAAYYTFGNFYNETLRYQRTVLKVDPSITYPTPEGIHGAIDAAIDNQDYKLAHVAEHVLADETNFFFGLQLGYDTVQFYEDPNPNDNYVFEIIDLRIPEGAKARALDRDYRGFMNIKQPTGAHPVLQGTTWKDPMVAHENTYRDDAKNEYLKNAYEKNWISIRDPFDVYNEDKVIKCEGLELSGVCKGKHAKSMYCSNLLFPNAWKCLALGGEFSPCELTGDDITC